MSKEREEIKRLASEYSFNIESLLFNQVDKEQQALWKKEIEQAFIAGFDQALLSVRNEINIAAVNRYDFPILHILKYTDNALENKVESN